MNNPFASHLAGLYSRRQSGANPRIDPEKIRQYKRPFVIYALPIPGYLTISYRTPLRPLAMDVDGRSPERRPSRYSGVIAHLPFAANWSPSSALPPELLSLVFIYAKPKKRLAHKIPFEVAVSHVCRFWRGVAQRTPELWDRIDIYSKRSNAWVHPYLERSLQRPLDVYIDIYRTDRALSKTINPLTKFDSIIKEFPNHFHRLRVFSLLCYHQTTAIYWQMIFQDHYAPILQSFSIKYGSSFSHIQRDFERFNTILDGGSHDRLTTIETDTPNILPPPENLRNLTTLYLHGLDPSLPISEDKFVEILGSLPSIVNLSLQGTVGFGFWPTGMPSTPQFALNNLKSLRLLDGGGVAIRMLLTVSALQLESLWLHCSYDNFPTHLFDAAQLTSPEPKFPNLKYLTIVSENFTMSSQFADIFPNITHLHYHYPNYQEVTELISTFANRWQSLQVLVFSAFKAKDAQKLNAALMHILTRRLNNNPLTKILVDKDHLRWLDRVVPEEAKKLRQLVQVDLLTIDNYSEYWWNIFERNSGRRLYSD